MAQSTSFLDRVNMQELGTYKVFDRKRGIVAKSVNGLKDARKDRDKRNKKEAELQGELEVPKNPNDWRYCLTKEGSNIVQWPTFDMKRELQKL